MTIQMKATEQYVAVLLYIMTYNGVLTFDSADKPLPCDPRQYFLVRCFRFTVLQNLVFYVNFGSERVKVVLALEYESGTHDFKFRVMV